MAGTYKGILSNDNNRPPEAKLTVNDAPIAPIKLSMPVPNNKPRDTSGRTSKETPSIKLINGVAKTMGNPVTNQCARIFANTER